MAVDELVTKDQTIAGSVGSPGVWPEVIAMVESGALQPSALVTHLMDLTEIVEAQALLRSRTPRSARCSSRPTVREVRRPLGHLGDDLPAGALTGDDGAVEEALLIGVGVLAREVDRPSATPS